MMADKIIQQARRMNGPIIVAMLALLTVGVVFIYSAVYGISGAAGTRLYEKQVAWAVLGLICFFGFALTDYHQLVRFAWLIYVAGIILLLLCFVPYVGLKMY